ncbi:unnamed protein product [Euphydryas editha]|uniref:C2H2-type domain-containing protein n=1 Tax=Euphydryas editha TaxID=104508 RepID=A0AAU9V2B1_EUPED|nr:unnamed protein product [Euphydryas editha]
MISSNLDAGGLDISNCRGQAYDNAAVMARRHSGVQQTIKEINLKVEFVPCSCASNPVMPHYDDKSTAGFLWLLWHALSYQKVPHICHLPAEGCVKAFLSVKKGYGMPNLHRGHIHTKSGRVF